jgi:hypothetical protein
MDRAFLHQLQLFGSSSVKPLSSQFQHATKNEKQIMPKFTEQKVDKKVFLI